MLYSEDHDLIEYILMEPEAAAGLGEMEEQLAGQLRQLMDGMPGGFFIYRADGNEELLYANGAMVRMLGCADLEELRQWTGNSFRGIVHPEDLDQVEESIWDQISHSRYDLDYVEYRVIRKDGEVRWVEDYGHFIRSEVGDVFCVFVGDATEKRLMRLQREASLQGRIQAYHRELEGLSEEHMRRLEVIEGLSADYESILYVNLEEDRVQTYRTSGRVGRQFQEGSRSFADFAAGYVARWVHPEDRKLVAEALRPGHIRERLADRKTFGVTYRVMEGEQEEYLQLHAVNVGSAERVSQVVLGARSVDEVIRKGLKQREALESALRRSSAAILAKDAFLANMSHDMRTPMNAILGFAALARGHLNDPERAKRYIERAEEAAGQLLRLINDVLDLSRLEGGQARLEEGEWDLREILRRVNHSLEGLAKRKHIRLSVDDNGLESPNVCTDGGKLEQLLTLFVDNAVKYTPEGGWVELTAAGPGRAVQGYGIYRLSVRDNGVGMDEDFLRRIFVPFERQQSTTISGIPGTGLGLSIAKGLADLLGGMIQVESAPGQGSCFTVELTLRLAKGEVLPGPEPKGALPAEGKILVVEDNELNVEIERELLEERGFRVDTAFDGKAAVELVQASRPGEYAMILMDIQMPVMDGYQASRAIRALPDPVLSKIPIVAVSANAFEEDRRKAIESGMDAHVAKPVDMDRLLGVMNRLLGGREK